ncbi:MAG: response regulator [Campylobacterales bacterium]|nr:response regulator [Campylobacterales bacterium]
MHLESLQHLTKTLRLLYVEDDLEIAARLSSILRALFQEVLHVKDGEEGLRAYETFAPHLILSDISMPKMNGLALCEAIKARNPAQRFIFSTAHSESQLLMQAIALNVDGYVLKPIDHGQFLALLKKVCTEIHRELDQRFYHAQLELHVKEKTQEIEATNVKLLELNHEIQRTLESTILSLGGMAESRSYETGLHVQRVAAYTEFLAKELGLSQTEVDTLRIVSPMHDIGKIAIEDHILKKPGKLSEAEYVRMKEHARLGYEMLQDSSLPLFRHAAIVAYEHHEKFNGKGYPRGLKGEEIHIFGRIMAFADVFDALISERVYKKPWPIAQIKTFVQEEAGAHFDPDIVRIFLRHLDFFTHTNLRLKDTAQTLYM